jgi:uncharacterized protein YjbI with pentapeptide repeats
MSKPAHLGVLEQGVACWNAWRCEQATVKPDLREAKLTQVDLTGADLSLADLREADLTGAKLMYADLSGGDLSRAKLLNADLSRADLSGATLTQAHLKGATLNQTDLSGATLSQADLSGAKLVKADLREADLSRATLITADLREAELSEADLSGATLMHADLRWAKLVRARLVQADLSAGKLFKAKLKQANLSGAGLIQTDLREVDLREANLSGATLYVASVVDTDLTDANLTGCRIYGMSAWKLILDGAKQTDLVITPPQEPEITVDNIEVAQFIYLLLHNHKIREIIDTITSKAVLILGRFMPERMAVLDALRDELRKRNYLPVVFSFEKQPTRTTDETITLLARMARFVIADISDAESVLRELRGFVPELPSVAVQPLILTPQEEPGMFDFLRKYPWALRAYRYDNEQQLIANLGEHVIRPAEVEVLELRRQPTEASYRLTEATLRG